MNDPRNGPAPSAIASFVLWRMPSVRVPSSSASTYLSMLSVSAFRSRPSTVSSSARKTSPSSWTSKLGEAEDIEHGLHDLEGDVYGVVVLVMRRPIPAALS